MTPEMIPWVIVRATGFTAIIALSLAMVAGLLVRTRDRVGPVKGAAMVDIHRQMSIVALTATAIHGLGLLFDRTVHVSLVSLVVPGLIEYRPLWTALGVVAAELALLVHLSFRWRARIGVTVWRRLHMVTYAVFAAGVTHGIMAGTDTSRPWAAAIYGAAVTAVAALTGWRFATMRRASGARTQRPATQGAQ